MRLMNNRERDEHFIKKCSDDSFAGRGNTNQLLHSKDANPGMLTHSPKHHCRTDD